MMAFSLLRYIIIELSVNTFFCVYNLYWSLLAKLRTYMLQLKRAARVILVK